LTFITKEKIILFLLYKHIELINKSPAALERKKKATFNNSIRLVILMTKNNANVCNRTELKTH